MNLVMYSVFFFEHYPKFTRKPKASVQFRDCIPSIVTPARTTKSTKISLNIWYLVVHVTTGNKNTQSVSFSPVIISFSKSYKNILYNLRLKFYLCCFLTMFFFLSFHLFLSFLLMVLQHCTPFRSNTKRKKRQEKTIVISDTQWTYAATKKMLFQHMRNSCWKSVCKQKEKEKLSR